MGCGTSRNYDVHSTLTPAWRAEGTVVSSGHPKTKLRMPIMFNRRKLFIEENEPFGVSSALWNEDILVGIFSWMDIPTLSSASMVCTYWWDVFCSETLWKILCYMYWPSITKGYSKEMHPGKVLERYNQEATLEENPTPLSWRQIFMELYSTFDSYFYFNDPNSLGGIIYHILHTDGSRIKVYASSVSRGKVTDFIAPEHVSVWTDNVPFSWFAVDFGEGRRVSPTHYTIRYSSTGNHCCPRNWELQGTNDQSGLHVMKQGKPVWTTIMKHVNDTTLDKSFGYNSWEIPFNIYQSYRFFRILQTGKNKYSQSPDEWSDVLVVGGFELHGMLRQSKRIFASNTGHPPNGKSSTHRYFTSSGIILTLGMERVVRVTASKMGTGRPVDCITRDFVHCWTKNEPFSWFAVDFGRSKRIFVTHYTIRYGSGGSLCCPRNWVLQATNDEVQIAYVKDMPTDKKAFPEDPGWHDLKVHHDDESFTGDFDTCTFTLTPPPVNSYRVFRLLQTGKNSYHSVLHTGVDLWSDVFVLSGFELYGSIDFVEVVE